MPLQVNASQLIKKLEAVKVNLERNVSQAISDMSYEMHQSITSMAALAWSPSWQSANTFLGKPYFAQKYSNPRDDGRTIGLLEAISRGRVGFDTQGGLIVGGIGDIETLNTLTMTPSGPYWKIFLGYAEYDRPLGVRAGGSDKYRFVSSVKTGEAEDFNIGYMAEVEPGAAGHPGVLPVFVFDETLVHYKPILRKKIKRVIKDSFKV